MVKGTTHSSKKVLMASVANSHTKVHRPVPLFTLPSTSEFAARSTDVFSNLSSLENKHETWMSVNETVGSFEDSNPVDPIVPVEVFKRPLPPLPFHQRKFVKRNAKKWIKYSLKDVPLSSDAANKAIAFQFLRDLRKSKEAAESEVSLDDKILFNRPVKGRRSSKVANKAESTSSSAESAVDVSDATNSLVDVDEVNKKMIQYNEAEKTQSVKLTHLDDSIDEE